MTNYFITINNRVLLTMMLTAFTILAISCVRLRIEDERIGPRTTVLRSLEGMSRAEVIEVFGKPSIVLTRDFREPTNGVPDLPVGIDEQFIYTNSNSIEHVYCYFSHDKCLLAIREWSSY